MKKFLLTAALVLALVTSLTAGTMAYYNVKVDTMTANLKTKAFVFTADSNIGSFADTVELAPGYTVVYTVNLNNSSEVPLDSSLVAKLEGAPNGITVAVAQKGGSGAQTSSDGTTATATKKMDINERKDTYLITVAWPYGDNALTNKQTTDAQGIPFKLKVDISGKQVEAITTIEPNA